MDEQNSNKHPHQNWKVKVYLLNELGHWDDCGTGILEIVQETIFEPPIDFFLVKRIEEQIDDSTSPISEERLQRIAGKSKNGKSILYLPILKENQFEKQGGNSTQSKIMYKIQ